MESQRCLNFNIEGILQLWGLIRSICSMEVVELVSLKNIKWRAVSTFLNNFITILTWRLLYLDEKRTPTSIVNVQVLKRSSKKFHSHIILLVKWENCFACLGEHQAFSDIFERYNRRKIIHNSSVINKTGWTQVTYWVGDKQSVNGVTGVAD